MFGYYYNFKNQIFNRKLNFANNVIVAPVTGRCVTLNQVPDQVFSTRVLGDGMAIVPNRKEVVAPINGTIAQVATTGHAFCIRGDDGIEIMIHVGVDTVELKGKGFKCFVKRKQKIKRGQLLCTIDLDFVRNRGYALHTIVVITSLHKIKNLKFLAQEQNMAELNRSPIMSYDYINQEQTQNTSQNNQIQQPS